MSCDLYKMRRMKLCIEFATIKNYKIARRKTINVNGTEVTILEQAGEKYI